MTMSWIHPNLDHFEAMKNYALETQKSETKMITKIQWIHENFDVKTPNKANKNINNHDDNIMNSPQPGPFSLNFDS